MEKKAKMKPTANDTRQSVKPPPNMAQKAHAPTEEAAIRSQSGFPGRFCMRSNSSQASRTVYLFLDMS